MTGDPIVRALELWRDNVRPVCVIDGPDGPEVVTHEVASPLVRIGIPGTADIVDGVLVTKAA